MDTNNPFNLYTSLDMAQFQLLSPTGSPAETAKNTIINRPIKRESLTASLLPAESMSGPSFDYDSYQQHTGLVTGSIANTHAINQSLYGNGFLSNMDGASDFNFNSPLPQASPFASPLTDVMDTNITSPVRQTVDPSRLQSETNSQSSASSSSSSANVRVYNGFHRNQAAAAAEAAKLKIKAEAQQLQQQQIIQQQQQQQQQQQRHAAQAAKPQRPKVQPPTDPLLEQKITLVLNKLRQQESSGMDLQSPESPEDANRSQSKDLDDMDEDERLLNSEEGKKLTPKERRQLRNKVSARHFRKRRKEMIGDLEGTNQALEREVATLKMEKEKLISDYQNLRKFVEHMIQTPNFAGYMQEQILGLSAQQNAVASPQVAQPRQRQRSQQTPQYGMSMIPEQDQTLQLADVLTDEALFADESMNDFSSMPLLSTQNSNEFDMFGDNTQIFAVLDTPQPSIDISALSGKTSNFVGHHEGFDAQEEKVEMPALEKGPAPVTISPVALEKVESSTIVDDDFDNDPAFALYHQTTADAESYSTDKPVEFDTDGLSHVDIFGGIEPEKVFERYELVDASEEEVGAALAMERVQRISSTIETVMARLELMTINL